MTGLDGGMRWGRGIAHCHGFALGVVLLLSAEAPAFTGQDISLRISIGREEVLYEILLSNDLANTLVPADRDPLRLSLQGDAFRFLDPDQEKGEREAFEEFFEDINPVTIDGVLVKPILRHVEFVPVPSPTGFDDPASLAMAAGFPPDVRIVLVYPAKGLPKQVSMVWDVYPEDPSRLMAGLEAAVQVKAELDTPDENRIIVFTQEEPEVIWHAPGKPAAQRVLPVVVEVRSAEIPIPVATLVIVCLWCIGLGLLRFWDRRSPRRKVGWVLSVVALCACVFSYNFRVVRLAAPWGQTVKLPGESESAEIFASLHRNVYRAFDYKTESDIYDVLAQSVDGRLLDQVYNEVYQSLIMRDQGGAVARVQSVEVLDTALVSSGSLPDSGSAAFSIQSRWRVYGTVYHWGHVHARTNEYQARYTIAQREDRWKIIGMQTLGQRRIVGTDDDPLVGSAGREGRSP